MLVDEQYVMLEARIEMRLQTQLDDDGVMVAVDVSVDTVEALEHVPDERGKRLREGYADAAWKIGLIIHV